MISHFAATQPTTPEKPNPNYNLSKLTYEKLQQLRKLSEKAKSSVTAHADDKDAVKKTSKLAMTLPKWLVLIGGVLLMIGILMAFLSSNYNSELMGEAQKGFAVFAPEPSSAEWQEKERLLWWVNFWFYFGLVLTAIGVALQTVGSILSLKNY